ncbi:hypothetical protein AURDEDRAFT_121799 [Auricularia subglabra TFB-10046 SS5]|nr:hypothetical protein AURDEDRAFT_121799 [Auricularia subglabra TFB-10046 SS5]
MSSDPAHQPHASPDQDAQAMTVLPPFREAFPALPQASFPAPATADDLLRPPQGFAAPQPLPQPPAVVGALDPAMQYRQSDVFTPRNAAPTGRTDDLFALHAAAMSSSGRSASSSGYSALDARHMPYDTRHRPASRSPPDAARSLGMPLPPQHPYAYPSSGLSSYHGGPAASYQPAPRVSHPHSSSRSTSQSASPDSDGNPSRFIILRPTGFEGDPASLDVAAYSQVSLPQAEWALSAGRLTSDSRSHLRVQDGGGTPESDQELSEGSGAPSRARGRRVRGSDASPAVSVAGV